jgi:hypothetical protein
MKKTKTRLEIRKVTVRVLQNSALVSVRGGGGGNGSLPSSDNPLACLVATLYCGGEEG